ncbi:PAS domain-containing sensor histidine kinase [Cohnella endophytica]|uniref:histidine kinase n=1 Tax=Cohnella endophytica TaxID=2419778 RepID=A0A494X336_9BACL|nr:PAS domain-containing sensor histidine kinase [Cohnella endophytica]RKP44772.1 PAS domain-containing sensor histidine kinase [Cohnella endophytica]
MEDSYFNSDKFKMRVLDAFLNLTSDAVYLINLEGKVLEVNKRFEELHGWTREEIIGKEVPLTPEEWIISYEIYERIVRGEDVTVYETVKHTKGGGHFYADVTISHVYNDEAELVGIAVIERDVTDKKRAEDQLKISEERYRVLVESSPEPIVVFQDLAIVYANPAAARLIGAEDPDQLIGEHISRFLHPDDNPGLVENVERLFVQGTASESFEKRLIRFDGQMLHVEFRAVPIDFHGIGSIQLLFRDMTDRKRAESVLEAKEREFSRVLKMSPEPILLHRAGVITFVNDMAIKLLRGISEEDFIDRPILDFFDPEYHKIIQERMARVIKVDEYMEFIELKLKCLDGVFVDVEVSSICVHRAGLNSVVQVVIRDLTERKKTDEMIRRSDKLSIAGELAAGVAHEIRNPLTALRGFMQLLQAKKTDYVDIMLMEIDRINYIVNEFIGMAKPQALHFVRSDLRTLLDGVIVFMYPQAILFNVEIKLIVQSHLPQIECEPNQIKQVYINVLKNAIEAMQGGGTIEITMYTKPEGSVVTRIVDQGVGIPQDRMEKIGEPFFSLKESGTGLGLMVCHRIIEAHDGKLTIHSVVNEGTTLEIELPTALR